MEPAADLIVDAAQRHLFEREPRHVQRLLVAAALPHAQQEARVQAAGELGRAPHAALLGIERLRSLLERAVEDVRAGQPGGGRGGQALPHRARDAGGVLLDPGTLLAVDARQLEEQAAEPDPRAAVAVARREISAGEEGPKVRGEKHAHRPAAVLGEELHRLHVDAVHVRPLLAVDLDADEALVEEARDLEIVERLLLHHVAPVAGRVADGEKHRLVRAPRGLECLLAPRAKVDRIVRVLQ